MPELKERLINCFENLFPDLGKEEIICASMSSVADWDSLAIVTLVSVLEEEFEIELGPDDPEQLVSFDLILDFLENKKNGQ